MTQEFEIKLLDLVKQKGFYPYEYMSDFEKFKEVLLSKEKLYSSSTDRKIIDKEYNMFLMIEKKKWNENNERLSRLAFKMSRFDIRWCA